MKLDLKWRLRCLDNASPENGEGFPAKVPGSVQLDYASAYVLPDYKVENNFEQYRWMEDKHWMYFTECDATGLSLPFLRFVAKGIDYKYDIYVDGVKKLSYEGMYRQTVLDLSEYIGKIFKIEIVIYPVPKSTVGNPAPNTRDEQNQCCKPAVSYGWDFHPRLIPLGIWEEAYVENSAFKNQIVPTVSYVLNGDRTRATVTMKANTEGNVKWRLLDPNKKTVFVGNSVSETFDLDNPQLWWCNGYGEPNLYSWDLVTDCDGQKETFCGKIGFKTVSLEMNPGTWDVPDFPKSRSCPPITLCLNGVEIFAKGTNWVCPEIFYSELDYERYAQQLKLIKEANMNIVRCWGGAVVNKEPFFEICDELGILVWQEFPLGCNNYHATDDYLSLLRRETNDIINRVAHHACLAIWCGGNELFNSWSGMTDQSLPLRMLNSITLEKTPHIPFLMTSPLMGMGHGSYLFVYHNGKEVIEVMQNSKNTAYTEFGSPALSNIECLKMITEPEKLFPLVPNDVTRAHHAFDAWGKGPTWCSVDTVEKYFGKCDSPEQTIEHSQYLQSVGYRFVFEEARRQKPYCSMAINWCFNEPWPCIANNSVVCYPNYVKPAYYEIAKACRPIVASARYRKLQYKAGENLEFDLFLLNDGGVAAEPMQIDVKIIIGDHSVKLMTWEVPPLRANTNFAGPTLRYLLPDVEGAHALKISLEAKDVSSEYTLLYQPDTPAKPKEKILNI